MVLLDQLPSAIIASKSVPAFCRRKAESTLMSLAVESGEDTLIIDFIQPAIVSGAAGECGSLVIRNMVRFWSSERLQDSVLEIREARAEYGQSNASSVYMPTYIGLVSDFVVAEE